MIRFYNAKIMSMSHNCDIIEGEIWVDGDKISYIGAEREDAVEFERQINANGNLIMPSFKNAHAHSAMTFLRSYADDVPLQQWLFEKVFPYEDKLTPDYVYDLTKSAILEYLSSGITAAISKTKAKATIRIVFFCSIGCLLTQHPQQPIQ